MNTKNNDSAESRHHWVLLGILGLVALAWSGILDGLSTQYIDKALFGSGAIYATARGINALVSVLQGTEMNAVLFSFTIGELLDPINDLIERFSGIMMLALGSLALQKILLELVSDATFNIMLTTVGGVVIAAHYLGLNVLYRHLAKLFLVTVIIRFSFAAVILANSWADAVFLDKNVAVQHNAMEGFHNELGLVSARAGIETGTTDEIRDVQTEISINQKAIEHEKQDAYLNRIRLEEAQAKLKAIDNRSWLEKLRGDTTIDIEGLKEEIRKLEKQIDDSEYTLSALQQSRESLEGKLDCLNKRSRGESCSLFDSARRAAQALNVKKQVEELASQVDEFASNLISLLMTLILKSIILPLLFFYILVRSVRYAFERL